MFYIYFIFALIMGVLFLLMAYNKTGEVWAPVMGAFLFILFWTFYNGFTVELSSIECLPKTPFLWLEAAITSFVGAIIGVKNTYNPATKKKGRLRFIVPVLFLIGYFVLL